MAEKRRVGKRRPGETGAWLILRAAYRGANFNNLSGPAGVFALNLNNTPSNANYNISFRAAKSKISRQTARAMSLGAVQSTLEP